MDLGDFIIPIIVIGSIIVQWLCSNKQNSENTAPPEQRRRSSETVGNPQGGEWDDLMEALGGNPASPPPVPLDPITEPTTLYQSPTPPPPVVDLAQKRMEEHQRALEEKRRQLEKLKRQQKPVAALDARHGSYNVAPSLSSIQKTLSDKGSLRKAILVNEILQPPVSLR